MIINVYVDDLVIMGNLQEMIETTKVDLMKAFDMTNLGYFTIIFD